MDPSPIGTPKILKIGSRKYAVGLRWVVADTANRDLRAQARQEIRDTGGGADLYVLREAQIGREVRQFGLGARADGLMPGAVAAAAAAANSLPGTWLGAFATDGGWWIVQVRNDAIVADGDAFYEFEREAIERFDRERRQDWASIYAPASWNVEGAREISIIDLLQGQRSPRLQEANPSGTYLKVALLVGLIAVGAGLGYTFWLDYQDRLAQEAAERERQEREARLRAALLARQQAQPIVVPAPWTEQPQHAPWFEHCQAALAATPSQIPGYRLSGRRCEPRSAHTTFARTDGFIGWAERHLEGRLVPGQRLVFPADQSGVEIVTQLPPRPLRGPEGVHDDATARRFLIEQAHATGVRLQITQTRVDPPAPPPGAPERNPDGTPFEMPLPPWGAFQITLDADRLGHWPTLLAGLPGFVPTRMSETPEGHWTIQGDVYVRR
jgi:hypothetical protein